MEQTNLVVTPDGKSWDEVTRDTSYLGPTCILATTDTATTWSTYAVLDEWRGGQEGEAGPGHFFNKDFAIAYNRVICLVNGCYNIYVQDRSMTDGGDLAVELNGNVTHSIIQNSTDGSDDGIHVMAKNIELKRGDYLQVRGEFGQATSPYTFFQVTKLSK